MDLLRFLKCGAVQRLIIALVAGMVWFTGLVAPAQADDMSSTQQYLAADGTDLTAMVQCLPAELSQGSFARALEQSKNDFLEKVFDVKDNYTDYKIDDTEREYLACMESKGVISQVMR
ncbi:hypothetical protein IQ254_19350 [Nodosilinea sp. LEGE 07088]|uniref:hypothetical protein n=1 Tax=Nodosilinea sp. LEGE 07088 TaxID=2777968 RepID=UPI00187E4DE8|nr:hypothetical protein [Nodosilinea sp. LEGE 07088]MBE9139327.1 hypothetical protein [Nodosilinea sp. LEGE 07088]